MRAWIPCALMATAAALLAACGDDDVDCSFEACGGDPVGVWNIDGACAPTTGGSDCPGATLVQSMSYSGTWTFDADMTYAVDGQTLQTVQGSFPTSCLGQIPTCEDLAAEGIECHTAGDRCECDGVNSAPYTAAGTWISSGSTLTLDGVSWTYCRDGGSLKMQSQSSELAFVLSR